MAMTLTEKKIALNILKSWRERFAQHEEAGREYAEQGYRNHYCVHGMNQWTDYDNICGMCEDGYGYWDYQEFLELSRAEAGRIYSRYEKEMQKNSTFFSQMFSALNNCDTPVKEAARKLMNEMMEETEAIIKQYI